MNICARFRLRSQWMGLVLAVIVTTGDAHASCLVPPSVSISVHADADGIVTGTVNYGFPDTENAAQRSVEVTVDEPSGTGVLGGFHPETASGNWPFTHVLSCKPSGVYTYKVKGISCGSKIGQSATSHSLDTSPSVSISYDGPDEFGHGTVSVGYNFPNTSSAT
jgi:hypothetical protein